MSIERGKIAAVKYGNMLTGRRLRAVHPGEVLLKDFIEPLELSRYRVAKAIGVPQRRIDEVCAGKRAVTADTALRLGRLFSVEPQFWMNLQSQYDLEIAERELGTSFEESIVPLRKAA
jgi:addiction module HigA family antidote